MVGWNEEGAPITTSYFSGKIEGFGGGFIGINDGEITSSYWDKVSTQRNNGSEEGIPDGVTGLTTSEMTGQSPYVFMEEFDYEEIWLLTENYPALHWENVEALTPPDFDEPAQVELALPENESSDTSIPTMLEWNPEDDAISYHLQVALNNDFEKVVIDEQEISQTTHSGENLQFNTWYYWRVRGVNFGGEGEWSETWSFFTEYALDTPSLASPEQGVENAPLPATFHWQPVDGAKDYELQISLSEDFESVLDLTNSQAKSSEVAEKKPGAESSSWAIAQKVENLNYSTQYFWRVRAEGDDGISDWSEIRNLVTVNAPITTPVTLSSPTYGSSDVIFPLKLTWDTFENADHYDLELALSPSFDTTLNIRSFEGTSFEIADLVDTTTYFWRVRGSVDEQKTAWSQVWQFKTMLRVPDLPVWEPDDEENDVETRPLLVWVASNRADYYHLQLSEESEFADPIIDIEAIDTTSFQVDEELEKGVTYYWRIRAGNESGYSDWSNPLNFTTLHPTSLPSEGIPIALELKQNYPNPFNPSTRIRFAIPEHSHVRLMIYNMLGQQVAILVNETRNSGWYEETFDASNLSSGLYIYRLQAEGHVETRQMLFMK